MLNNNEYFDGNVKSIGFESQGDRSSVGVMQPGVYTFSTAAPERMTVVKGAISVKLPGHVDWETYNAGDDFEVPGDASFEVQIQVTTAYLCDYL
ncbi:MULTISPECIES: pyrimidine/purine nucleoside phosphorylase [unclassified Photobacterium]|uniref:pyrimidine/purine nucleoside phosphorylase n=1 Tax=unclassified Photobacterium TaxID=2628852 RepID=UPI001B8CB2B3|nr:MULTISPECIES: pyrimidine/purine nucleoside phosphorylase [unclassified Photobacterium]MDO6707862.1 pyrimidine/purine nucleoside phosphorylase [Photobacterium sp. 1_MG-2023]QUJ67647.1 pyrimidine/purine nucleoside phosphorylase [Photobacterium sp. GJ3]